MDVRLINTIKKVTNLHTPYLVKTPSFLFDLNILEDNYKTINSSIAGGCEIRYALKANSEDDVIEKLKSLGSGFEIASLGELTILKKHLVDPRSIFFSSPVKIPEHISAAYEYGVSYFGFDSVEELIKLKTYAPHSTVYLRIQVSNHGSNWKLEDKFGALKPHWQRLMVTAKKYGLKPEGITFHVGWNNESVETWKNTLKVVEGLINKLHKSGINITFIDLGGGFPAHKIDQFKALKQIVSAINPLLKKLVSTYKLQIFAEPGTFLVANCGLLMTKIFAKIKRRNTTWLYVDSSMTNGFYWILAGLQYEIDAVTTRKKQGKNVFYNVTGPTCDSHETFQKRVLLPSGLQVGDVLIISPAGAYISSAKEYNSFPYPQTIFLK